MNKLDESVFKCATRWGVSIAEMMLPVFYHDNSKINVIYSASTKRVRHFLPDDRMHPLEIQPGRCLVAFSAFEYRITDIGLYNKFSIGILISYGRKRRIHKSIFSHENNVCFDKYIRHLPVTTEAARIGGVETYGYPKVLADIDFSRDSSVTECRLMDKKKHVLTLRVPELPTYPGQNFCYKTYATREGITLCSNIYTKYHEYAETINTGEVELIIGDDHDICRELNYIELSRNALMYQYIPSCESLLSIPRNAAGG